MTDQEYITLPEFLSAAETGARGELTMAALETRLIVAATRHANRLGIGFDEMLADGNAWVLSRMSIEMERMPAIHDTFSIVTWIETLHRHLSRRNFTVIDSEGRPIGHARSVWASINIASRHPATVTVDGGCISGHPCPIADFPRHTAVETPGTTTTHTFTFSDIDFNRHVNSARYVDLIEDAFGLEYYDIRRISRLDIAYVNEAPFGATALTRISPTGTETFNVEIADRDSATIYCRGAVAFTPAPSRGFRASKGPAGE